MHMETVYFITSNKGKVTSANAILRELQLPVTVQMLMADYPEDKSIETTDAIAKQGAQYCAAEHNKPVIVTDVGLFIDELNGFPGINTAFSLKRIGTAGLLRLLDGKSNRAATWELSLAYASPEAQPEVFTAKLAGIMSQEERGNDGFGFDPIFIPDGHQKTLAEDPALRDTVSPFREALKSFGTWYTQKHT